jgi:hypothetical protein
MRAFAILSGGIYDFTGGCQKALFLRRPSDKGFGPRAGGVLKGGKEIENYLKVFLCH